MMDAQAQFNLGRCYSDGRGVDKDYAEAIKWHRKAADQKYAEADAVMLQIEALKNAG